MDIVSQRSQRLCAPPEIQRLDIDKYYSRLLVRHPAVLQKLCQEISNTLSGKQDIHRDDLQKMEYLTKVLKESKVETLIDIPAS
jgi:Cytochrome P450